MMVLRLLAFILLMGNSVCGEEDWWAFQAIEKPPPPQAVGVEPIDAFVKADLAARELQSAPTADPATLIKRLHFDLTGLPPSFETVEAFCENFSQATYASLVDRLLDSDHFGERWARHWLDVVRFAETNGYERDAVKPHIWKYRDWVVRAFNDDMPFDEFVRARTTQSRYFQM